ncbi:MAG: anhydro-N-acetylmuramic acid kinase [Alphaproteobacteria bacterium]
MSKARLWRAIGLMSGTSADGIDAALIETDGEGQVVTGPALSIGYDADFSGRIKALYGQWQRSAALDAIEDALTRLHAAAVERLLADSCIDPASVDVIGFHGQTVAHDPARGRTWQIGDGPLLADLLGIDVVHDLRSADVAAGGEGAPLVPVYHAALAAGLERPLAVVNIGGVANVTWLPADGNPIAFDTGPGNGPIDDWVGATAGLPCDRDGRLAASGRIDEDRLARWLADPYFARPAPKSLDRKDFADVDAGGLSLEDGAATLTAFTACAIGRAAERLPAAPLRWLVTGGGRHNPTLMRMLADAVAAPVAPVEAVGWDGDALEAQAFAYLAVRSLRGLPLTYPGTTGAPEPLTGGRLAAARLQAASASRSSR